MSATSFAVFAAILILQSGPDLDRAATSEYGGVYAEVRGGALMIIAPVDDSLLRYRSLQDGAFGTLARTGPDLFSEDGGSIRFERGPEGAIAAATWRFGGQESVRGARMALRQEEVGWRSREASLSGTLVLPPGEGPHPTVIVQPGSSWTTRLSSNSLETAYTFAAYGIAAFAYDKRGWGASTGDQLVSFETSALDLVAAVERLSERFDLDPRRLGVWALSQGAWIAPLAGSMSDDIHYFVLVGAPGTSPARQEIQRAGALLEAQGFPLTEIRAIREFQAISFHYSVTGEGWGEYVEARERAEDKKWLRFVWSPSEPGPANFLWGRLNGYYNPLPSLLALDEPVLALWGEYDVNVLPEVHRSIFEVALHAAENDDFTLVIVPGAEHSLQVATSRAPEASEDRFAPGVWERMAKWVLGRVCQRGEGVPAVEGC